jgi:hypothetical protein
MQTMASSGRMVLYSDVIRPDHYPDHFRVRGDTTRTPFPRSTERFGDDALTESQISCPDRDAIPNVRLAYEGVLGPFGRN